MVNTINTFVDSVFTGQFLCTEAMAAMSFFAPVVTMTGMLFVIVSGGHILCGKHLGAGEGDAVQSLFSTQVVFLSLCSIGISVVCILYRHPLARLLGAQNLLLMLSSGILPSLFYPPWEEAWFVTRRMMLLFPGFLVLNTVFLLLLKSYQIQEQMALPFRCRKTWLWPSSPL
jgi:hypothetical protein